jgi:hypothetical protein
LRRHGVATLSSIGDHEHPAIVAPEHDAFVVAAE